MVGWTGTTGVTAEVAGVTDEAARHSGTEKRNIITLSKIMIDGWEASMMNVVSRVISEKFLS